MEAAQTIREAVAGVELLRQQTRADARLAEALREVKRVQARRFAGTYADLLAAGPYGAAARFFLDELYSDKDYTERDAQFARIASAIEKLFPAQVAQTAVSLAQLHALTEALDFAVAGAWLAEEGETDDARRYALAWRAVGRRADRQAQLAGVLAIGDEMVRLTRLPGLRMMLKMMRAPASAAGLGALQRFLETGFDTFATMVRGGHASGFLRTVDEREAALLQLLFDAPFVACETGLARILGQAR